MMHIKIDNMLLCGLCAGLLLLSGCLGAAQIDRTQFYLLNSLYSADSGPGAIAALTGTAIGVGPVRVPAQLDRLQIVTRKTPNEIRLADNAEWAEPLATNFTRVLAENLSYLLATDDVAIFPWLKTMQLDYQVTVDITRLSASPGDQAILRARWTIFGAQGQTELHHAFSKINMPVEANDVASMVKAQSRAVEALSRQIAMAISSLSEERQPKSINP
jgi:hypothetical protein